MRGVKSNDTRHEHLHPEPRRLNLVAYLMSFFLAFLGTLTSLNAEMISPGPREFEGWVMQRADGQVDVWNGFFCAGFPAGKSGGLHSHVGKFVEVVYNMTGNAGTFSGVTFDRILAIKVIEDTPENFPILVAIEPLKKEFTSSEPIAARVTLENRSQQVQSCGLVSSHAILSKDYEKVIWLEPDKHDFPDTFYRFEAVRDMGWLNPGERIVFIVESSRMAEPGEYDLSYTLSRFARDRRCASKMVGVKVVPPADGDRAAVLRTWLRRAAFSQRVDIVNELAKMGDVASVAEFVAQLKAGEDRKNGFFYHQAYDIAFRRGGSAGEEVMLERIRSGKFQESVADYIRYAFASKNKVGIFTELLSCQHAVEMAVGGWVTHPRVCDITADILMGNSSSEMSFPRQGDETARNKAVDRVQKMLKSDPGSFRGFQDTVQQ